MDATHGIIYLTGADGVRKDKTRQITRIRYDAHRQLYLVNFVNTGKTFCYKKENVKIVRNVVVEKGAGTVFDYLKDVASLCGITNESGENVLVKNYDRLRIVNHESALAFYLDPKKLECRGKRTASPIFPFGCNNSQFKAVKAALENRLSVIQGPPGTGKTQTILNIIANLILARKTILVVSNNNSAIDNIKEKLASGKYGLGFLIALLGRSDNIIDFLEHQSDEYPSELENWLLTENDVQYRNDVICAFDTLKHLFDYQEREAQLKQELSAIETEYRYFSQTTGAKSLCPSKKFSACSSETAMNVWLKAQSYLDRLSYLPLWFRFVLRFRYGIGTWMLRKLDPASFIRLCKETYYVSRMRELHAEIGEKEKLKEGFNLNKACSMALSYLKHVVAKRYSGKGGRKVFSKEEFARDADAFYKEYPVALSTTFSSRRCLPYFSQDFLFDYVIMDEASQVDVATGALALSCAWNAVIVGDKMQLPNVVTTADKKRARDILAKYNVNRAYDFSEYSFLASIETLFPSAPQTLLREHYRCHPKIINFCNQKFYNNQLVIMTSDHGEADVINLYMTRKGNHCRGHVNQRQVDVIAHEILPTITKTDREGIGIISPYRDQAKQISASIPEIQSDTVHKFQGREKEVIIISTTDDQITPFADDANLLNVAISRAKSSLYIVMSGNVSNGGTNIGDLVSYINYNNFTVTQSRINSIFDYLYGQYSARRLVLLAKVRSVSQYSSENLMYGLLLDILKVPQFSGYGVIFEQPLKELISIECMANLTEEECRYATNDLTHIDFLIYNKITKRPVLAIEVDGYKYHKAGSRQAARDEKKNAVLAKCGLELLRLSTTGSQEREKIISALVKAICVES